MARRRKSEVEVEDAQVALDFEPAREPEPVPVRVVQPKSKHPDIGKFPWHDEELPKKRYVITDQTNMTGQVSFNKGITVLNRNTLKRQTMMVHVEFMSGEETEQPILIADHLRSIRFKEKGRSFPRFQVLEL